MPARAFGSEGDWNKSVRGKHVREQGLLKAMTLEGEGV